MKEKNVLGELSRRINNGEKDIIILREKTTRLENNQALIIATLEKIDNTLNMVYQNQNTLADKFINSNKGLSERLNEAEKTTRTINFAASHWKIIVWIIVISAVIGFSFENGVRDILYHFTNTNMFKTLFF